MPLPSDHLEQAAAAPKKATNDTGSVERHSLTEQIALDKHLGAKRARPRLQRLVPPGADGR